MKYSRQFIESHGIRFDTTLTCDTCAFRNLGTTSCTTHPLHEQIADACGHDSCWCSHSDLRRRGEGGWALDEAPSYPSD